MCDQLVCCLQVLLVSAQQALLSRLVLQGKPDKDIALRFGRLAFGSRAKKFSLREHKQAAEEMLADSGLAELEETVLAFLYAHSGSVKLLALTDDIVRMLQQVRSQAHVIAYFVVATFSLNLLLQSLMQQGPSRDVNPAANASKLDVHAHFTTSHVSASASFLDVLIITDIC